MTKGYMDVRACIEQGQDGERKYCCDFFLNSDKRVDDWMCFGRMWCKIQRIELRAGIPPPSCTCHSRKNVMKVCSRMSGDSLFCLWDILHFEQKKKKTKAEIKRSAWPRFEPPTLHRKSLNFHLGHEELDDYGRSKSPEGRRRRTTADIPGSLNALLSPNYLNPLTTLMLPLFAGTLFCEFLQFGKIAKLSTRKNFYQHIRHHGVYTITNCMVFSTLEHA